MSLLYAMQRANGDWFALDDGGRFRVPVFRHSREGLLARIVNPGMRLFKPSALDARALKDLVAPEGARGDVYFWLIDSPFTNVNRGHSINHAQLTQLVHQTVEQ